MSGTIQNLTAINKQLASIGSNHARMDASGEVRTTTRTKVDRFIGRIFAKIDSKHANAMNKRTIDQLCKKIENIGHVGKKYAALFRERAESVRVDGVPLSGRKLSAVLSKTLEQAIPESNIHDVIERKVHPLTMDFMSATGPHSFESAVAELEQKFGLAPGQSGLANRKEEMAGKIEAKVGETFHKDYSAASIAKINAETTEEIGKKVLLDEFITNHIETHIDEIHQRMRERDGLGAADVDMDALAKYLVKRTDRSVPDMAGLDSSIRVIARIFAQDIRSDYIAAESKHLLAIDDAPDSLFTEYSQAARKHSQVTITHEMIETLRDYLVKDLTAKYRLAGANAIARELPSPEQLQQMRTDFIAEFFQGAQDIQTKAPQGFDPIVVRDAYLTAAVPVDSRVHQSSFDLAVGVQAAVTSAMESSNRDTFLDTMAILGRYYTTNLNAAREQFDLEPDEVSSYVNFAFRLGVSQALKEGKNEDLETWISSFNPPLQELVNQHTFPDVNTQLAANKFVEQMVFAGKMRSN